MVKMIDISKWPTEISDVVTIGKRIKKVVYHPTSFREHYFKEPKEDFPWEFWNEVIASRIGIEFGFNVLQYDVAFSSDSVVGCFSKSMVRSDEMLVHGQQYLTGLKLNFVLDIDNEYDKDAVKLFKNNVNIGFVKRGHNKFFHKVDNEQVDIRVKSIDRNGNANQIYFTVKI